MRRAIYLLLLLVISLGAMAARTPRQPKQDHLTFRDIPICGQEKPMRDSLRSRDFRWGMDGRVKGYQGLVAGRKMTMQIWTTPESEEVYSLVAFGPKIRKWDQLKAQYLELKDLLRQKYGRPMNHTERFHKLVLSRGARRRAVTQGKCDYRSTFRANGGLIILYIDSDRRVCLEFQDAAGNAINEEEIMREL
ncbi:MAG: hypothetical protein KBS77_03860 [Bacteroidales bacterium]|nr:hypothetical protein [Candidatus Colicola faecequi]